MASLIILSDLKSYLKITDSSNDTNLQRFIDNGTSFIESLTNRDLRNNTYTEYYDGNDTSRMYLRVEPIESVTSIKVYDTLTEDYIDIFSAGDTVNNSLIIYSDEGEISLKKSYIFSTGIKNIQIVYKAGYNAAANWVTATAYNQGEYTLYNSQFYKCLISHTSGTFATDLAAGKWELTTAPMTPLDLKQKHLEISSLMFYDSPVSGKNRLGLSNENIGGASSEGKSFKEIKWEDDPIIQGYKFLNI